MRSTPVVRKSGMPGAWVTVAVIVCLYLALMFANAKGQWHTHHLTGHYQSLAAGILKGQVSLTIQPNPQLANLENPWAGYQGVERVHDATYHNGRYYLYFGITPVFLFYIPAKLIAGEFPSDTLATTWFSLWGFIAYSCLWLRMLASFARPSTWMTHLGIVGIGLGNFIPMVVASGGFYGVPISAAYACSGFFFLFLWRSLERENTAGRSLLFLTLASIAAALLVGARPNWVFITTLIVIPSGILAFKRRTAQGPVAWWKVAGAAGIPLAIGGALLAYYNYHRFGSPTDFGIKYQFAANDQRFIALWSWSHVPAHLLNYFFSSPDYSLYFPFLRIRTTSLSLLGWASFATIGLLAPAAALLGIKESLRTLRMYLLFTSILGLAGVINLVALSGVAFQNERYALDFLPLLTLSALLLLAVFQSDSTKWPVLRKTGLGVALIAFAATVFHSMMLCATLNNMQERAPGIARQINRPFAVIDRLFGAKPGPLLLSIEFPVGEPGTSEPLVVSASGRDTLYIRYLSPETGVLRFFHRGQLGPVGEEFALHPGVKRTLRVEMGGLYPTANHPLFMNWGEADIRRARRSMKAVLDDEVILDREVMFYESDPSEVTIGRSPNPDVTNRDFTGKILEVERLGVPSEPPAPSRVFTPGWFEIKATIPSFAVDISEPLLHLGTQEAGNLFYIRYVDTTHFRIGYGTTGSGVVESKAVEYTPDMEYAIQVGLTAAETQFPDSIAASVVSVFMNGEPILWANHHAHPFTGSDVAIGKNEGRLGYCGEVFSGPKISVRRVQPQAFDRAWTGAPSSIHLVLNSKALGKAEPLLVMGDAGRADCIGIEYLDQRRVRFLHDHRGHFIKHSEPFEVTFDEPQVLDLELQALPDASTTENGLNVRIVARWNGKEVWQVETVFHQAASFSGSVGTNNTGFSSVSEVFSGEIIKIFPIMQSQ